MEGIVAVDRQWGIGCDGKLLTRLSGDLKNFRKMTVGKVVVMGRKTLLTFPEQKPLKDRENIILTRNKDFECEGAKVVNSIDELNELLKTYPSDQVMVIGGESIYKQLLDLCNTYYVTKIQSTFNADTFFPNLDEIEEWQLVEESDLQEENGLKYTFCKYIKK